MCPQPTGEPTWPRATLSSISPPLSSIMIPFFLRSLFWLNLAHVPFLATSHHRCQGRRTDQVAVATPSFVLPSVPLLSLLVHSRLLFSLTTIE